MNRSQVEKLLRQAIKKAGGARPWAEANGMADENVYLVLRGKRPPARTLLAALGLRRAEAYERIPIESPHNASDA